MPKPILNQFVLTCACFALSTILSAQEMDCNYFGLAIPGATPEDFNPEILDLGGGFKFNVEIKKCDEIYFTTIDEKENIYFSKLQHGDWSNAKIASFSDPNYSDADPFLTKDGTRIYFISDRPTHSNDDNQEWNIWYVDQDNVGWAYPKPLPEPVNSPEYDEYFFSISDQGNAFFSSSRSGGEGSFDIYTVKILGNNQYSEPKNVGAPISTSKYEFDPYISADESLILFSINENGNSSLYFSYRDDHDHWTEPQNLGDQVNISRQDFAPSLSSDGKYIFYSNNGKLKWVSVEILGIPNTSKSKDYSQLLTFGIFLGASIR